MCVRSLVSLESCGKAGHSNCVIHGASCVRDCSHAGLSTERWSYLTNMTTQRKHAQLHIVPLGLPQPSVLTSPKTIIPQLLPPPLLNGCGWDGVKVITEPWIFVPTHFISVRLPTGKSMSSALMKDLHLCPMVLLVFIFFPNMVSMRSPDTVVHASYSMSNWWIHSVMQWWRKAGCSQVPSYSRCFSHSLDNTSNSRDTFCINLAASTWCEGYVPLLM